MRTFTEILDIAIERKGSLAAVEASIPEPLPLSELETVSMDRWLSRISINVFRAGFNRKTINDRWQAFEAAFKAFDVNLCAGMDAKWREELLQDQRIVRNVAKVESVKKNAIFILDKTAEHGSFGNFLYHWDARDFRKLLECLNAEGDRLGDKTAQYFLREAGIDSYILSFDVVERLRLEGVANKLPTSSAQRQKIQDAFDQWQQESGKTLTYISRVLAMSVPLVRPSRFKEPN